MLMTLVMLDESQSNEDKKQTEASREDEIVNIIIKSGTAILCLIVICIAVTSVVFYARSRKIKEIGWLPKFIIGLANINGIILSSYYIINVFLEIKLSTTTRLGL